MEKLSNALAHAVPGNLICLVAEDREDDRCREQAGGAVADADRNRVAHTLVLTRTVGSHGNDAAERETEREEDLTRGVQPHLWLQQLQELHKSVLYSVQYSIH